MLITVLSVLTTVLSFAASLFWFLIFRKNEVKYLSALFVVAGLVHWMPEVSQSFSIVLFIVSFAVVTYVTKHNGLQGFYDENKPSGPVLSDLSGAPVVGRYAFSYSDAEGRVTRRKVDVHQIWEDSGATYFKGFCHHAEDMRTFRLDRVFGEVIDLDTGEVVDV